MMAQLSERDRRALRFGGFGAAAILLFLLVGSPLMDEWDRLNRRIADAEKQIRVIESNVQAAVAAGQAMKELQAKATIYRDDSELDQQTAAMLQQIARLPAYPQLGVQRLEGLPLREEDEYYRSGVSLQYSGTLAALHAFLQQVEAARPALKVERLSVMASAKDSRRVEGQMVLSGYAVVARQSAKGAKGRG